MKQLQNLFSAFSEIHSPGAPKNIIKELLKTKPEKGYNELNWSNDRFILTFESYKDEYNLHLSNLDGDVLYQKEGTASEYREYVKDSNEMIGESFMEDCPIQEWDEIEKEIFIREEILKI